MKVTVASRMTSTLAVLSERWRASLAGAKSEVNGIFSAHTNPDAMLSSNSVWKPCLGFCSYRPLAHILEYWQCCLSRTYTHIYIYILYRYRYRYRYIHTYIHNYIHTYIYIIHIIYIYIYTHVGFTLGQWAHPKFPLVSPMAWPHGFLQPAQVLEAAARPSPSWGPSWPHWANLGRTLLAV